MKQSTYDNIFTIDEREREGERKREKKRIAKLR